LKGLVRDWLAENYPDRMKHVLSLVEGTRDGKLYDSKWGQRQTGVGPYAWMIGRRFEKGAERFGFNRTRRELRTDLFRKPAKETAQLALF
jgi:DNA repair photolyase